MSLEERSLRHSTVRLFGLGDHDGLVFEVVENSCLSNSKVFKAAFYNALLRVGVKSQDLNNKLIRN